MRKNRERTEVYKEDYEELQEFRDLHLKTEVKNEVSQEQYFKAIQTIRDYNLQINKERSQLYSIIKATKELEDIYSAIDEFDNRRYWNTSFSSQLSRLLEKEFNVTKVIDLLKIDIRTLRGTPGFGKKGEEVLMCIADDCGIELNW
jgi:predicted  nucleic acid-binding Zn-ribbon protein